jgi:hypothetical protein
MAPSARRTPMLDPTCPRSHHPRGWSSGRTLAATPKHERPPHRGARRAFGLAQIGDPPATALAKQLEGSLSGKGGVYTPTGCLDEKAHRSPPPRLGSEAKAPSPVPKGQRTVARVKSGQAAPAGSYLGLGMRARISGRAHPRHRAGRSVDRRYERLLSIPVVAPPAVAADVVPIDERPPHA